MDSKASVTPFDELAETCAAILDLYVQWAKRRGLSANEFFVLYMLGSAGSCTSREIGEEWHLPKQTVSFVCRQLQEKGWLAVDVDAQDKRGRRLRLTPAGEALALPMVAELSRLEQRCAERFGAQELIQLLQSLKRLHVLFSGQLEASDEH